MIDSPAPLTTLIPRDALPIACQRLGCDVQLVCSVIDVGDHAIYHKSGGVVSRLALPDAWLIDVDRDIWGSDVAPWLVGLHAEEPAE